MRIGEGMRTFGAMKNMLSYRSVSLNVKKELYERIVVPTVMYRSETLGMKREKKNKLDVSEMQCLRSMCGVTRWNRMRNVAVRERESGCTREKELNSGPEGFKVVWAC